MMMGGFLACASCHGPAGKGGTHEMYNYTMVAPDIRFITLNARKQGLTGTNPSSQPGKAGEYDIEDLNRALIEGLRPDSSGLNEYMPRWILSDQDLTELLEYLKTLP